MGNYDFDKYDYTFDRWGCVSSVTPKVTVEKKEEPKVETQETKPVTKKKSKGVK